MTLPDWLTITGVRAAPGKYIMRVRVLWWRPSFWALMYKEAAHRCAVSPAWLKPAVCAGLAARMVLRQAVAG